MSSKFWPDQANNILQQINIEHPIIQAPMAGGPSTPELAAAVSNSGGLGSLGAGYLTPEQLDSDIQKVKTLTDRPFNVNLFVPESTELKSPSEKVLKKLELFSEELGIDPPQVPANSKSNFQEQIEVILSSNISVFSFTFGIPNKALLSDLKSRAVFVIGTATSVEEGLLLEEAGCNAIVAQGLEAGGHRGSFSNGEHIPLIGSLALTAQIVSSVKLPVIASGGIMDGRGIAASMALGASAVQMGTAFLGCKEAGIPKPYRDRLNSSSDTSTVLTKAFSGKYARGIKNKFTDEMASLEEEVASYPIQNTLTRPLRNAAKNNDNSEFLSLWAGQGSGLTRSTNAEKLIKELVLETKNVLKEISSNL